MSAIATKDLTVIIPAFNEAAAIAPLIESLTEAAPGAEILVIDDGSSDDTASIASAAGARVIPHAYNIGNGAAVKTGLRHASREFVVLMDADGQHRATDIAKVTAPLSRYNMVVGARSASSQAGWHRWLANSIYNWLASYVTEFPVEDLTSGFRAMRTSEARRYLELLPNTFSYPTTLTLAYLRSGLTLAYVPIVVHRRVGTSKIRLWKDGTRFLLILSKIATLFAPFRVFLPVSLAFLATGLSYYLYTFITAHRFTNMAALLLSTSVIIFMLGLVSEQIALMRTERVDADRASREQSKQATATKRTAKKRASTRRKTAGSAASDTPVAKVAQSGSNA